MKLSHWEKILLIAVLDIFGIVAILSTTTRAEEQFLLAAPTPTPRSTRSPAPSPTAKVAPKSPRDSTNISLNRNQPESCVRPNTSIVFTWTLTTDEVPITGTFTVTDPAGQVTTENYPPFIPLFSSPYVSHNIPYTVPTITGTYRAEIQVFYLNNPIPDVARIHFDLCGSLHVHKFKDTNANGNLDPGEPGIAGWPIMLTPPSDAIPPPGDPSWIKLTNSQGDANWDYINQGPYTVREQEGAPDEWRRTTPNPISGVVVPPNQTITLTFGNQPLYCITGKKTDDRGTGLSGWTIHAQGYDPITPILTTTTDAQGQYRFDTRVNPELTVPPSRWAVWEELKPGWQVMKEIIQTVYLTERKPPAPPMALGGSQNPILRLFLPMIVRSSGQTSVSASSCGSADFQNRQIPPESFYPKGIAVDPKTRYLYVGVQGENRVYVLDPSLGQIAPWIQVRDRPFGIAVNELTRKVYVANYGDNSISVISTVTNTVVATISLTPYGEPTYVGVYGTKVYVPLHASGKLAVIDGNTDTVVNGPSYPIDVGSGAFGLAIDALRRRAYVSSRDAQWVSVVDLDLDRVISRINLGPAGQTPHYEPYALGLDSGLAQLYTIIHPYPDPNKGVNPEEVWTYRLPPAPPVPGTVTPPDWKTIIERGGDQAGVGIVVNPTTHNVFVTNPADESISCFNGDTPPTNAKRIGQSSDGRPFKTPMLLAVDRFYGAYGRIYVTNHHSPPSDGIAGAIGIINDTLDLCK